MDAVAVAVADAAAASAAVVGKLSFTRMFDALRVFIAQGIYLFSASMPLICVKVNLWLTVRYR